MVLTWEGMPLARRPVVEGPTSVWQSVLEELPVIEARLSQTVNF